MATDKEEKQKLAELDRSGLIDISTFQQILEMDEGDPSKKFSASIVDLFFEQTKVKFPEMDDFLKRNNFEEVSRLGHFLKGSAAMIGLIDLIDSFEKIQHLGHRKDESGVNNEPNDDVTAEKLTETIALAKQQVSDVMPVLEDFFPEKGSD